MLNLSIKELRLIAKNKTKKGVKQFLSTPSNHSNHSNHSNFFTLFCKVKHRKNDE